MARPLVLTICALGTACIVVGAPPPDTAVQWLKTRAGSDFECPSSEVTTVTLDDNSKVATECGFLAKYVLVCDRRMDWLLSGAVNVPVLKESDCAWKFDSSVESQASQRPGNERLAPRPFARAAARWPSLDRAYEAVSSVPLTSAKPASAPC